MAAWPSAFASINARASSAPRWDAAVIADVALMRRAVISRRMASLTPGAMP